MMKKIVAALVLLFLGVICFIYFRRPQTPQNLILITIDTLRADHLGVYGYRRDTSPALDERAKTGIVFEHAMVQWPKTVPSMVSIFSSTYPHTNGILFGSRGQFVRNKLTTITEIVKEQGFQTYGIVSNAVLADATNFSQGFDEYKETWLDQSRGNEHSRADHVTDLAIKALNELKDKKRFFLWIHYVDPHYRYKPPAPYDEMYVGDKFYDKNRVLKKNDDPVNYYDGIAGRVWELDHRLEPDYYVAQYDAEIRYTDDNLKRLFDEIDRHRLWKKSLVCLTADHGESLGENHYFFEHGWFPYTSCTNVPLIVWSPGEKPARISNSIAMLDLVPSLLQKLKIPSVPSFEGKPWNFETPAPIYIEAGEGRLNRMNYIRSLWQWPYHLIYVPSEIYQGMMQHRPFELYNVAEDWGETKNLVDKNPEIAKRMEAQLLKWIESAPNYVPPNAQTPDYDPEAIEQMESLGYVK